MGKYADQAVFNHKNWYSCSASVLCAFADQAGLSERQARSAASPYASGRQGKCGAVLSAEYVLKAKYGGLAAERIKVFHQQFLESGKPSLMCSDLAGSCRACVRDASLILEKLIVE